MPIIDMHELAIVQDWMYGINYKYSVLCKINSATNEIVNFYSLIIKGEKLQYDYATEFYRHILATDKYVFVVNTITNLLLIFNSDLCMLQQMYIHDRPEHMNIIGIRQNTLFIYAISSGIILGIDLADWKITKYEVPSKYVGKINTMEIKILDDCLWLTGYMGNCVLEISIEDGKTFEHEIRNIQGDICLCNKIKDNILFCTQFGVFEWDRQNDIAKKVFHFPLSERKDTLMPFYYSCAIDDFLWLFPLKETRICKIGNKHNNVEFFEDPECSGKIKRQKTFSYLEKNSEKKVLYALDKNMNSIIMNINTCEIQKACFLLSDSMLQEMKKSFFALNLCLDEKLFSISELLEMSVNNVSVKNYTNIGQKIYKF